MSEKQIPTNLHEGTDKYDNTVADDSLAFNAEMGRQRLIAETRRRMDGILNESIALTGNQALPKKQEVVLGGERRWVSVNARRNLLQNYGNADFTRVSIIDPGNLHILHDLTVQKGHDNKVTAEYCEYKYDNASTYKSNWRKAPDTSNKFTYETAAEGIPELPYVTEAVTV